ncbi:MAG: ABC transporter ATP-binding protein [Chromatiales bacterium]
MASPIRKPVSPLAPPAALVEIRTESLHKCFDGPAVLRGISLAIPRGDVVAIVGGSGCGKTVLLNHVLGLLTPDRGKIQVADHDQPGAPLRDLAALSQEERDRIHTHWGVVFQRNALFSGTVYDNLALWLREVRALPDEEIRPIAQAALAAVGLAADEEFLGRSQENLSGGMAKRLAVARAVATDPAVLFYDEPTTGLDPTSSAQIHDLIHSTHHAYRTGSGGRTTVIITHDKDLLYRLRPRTIMLHEGKVHFDGAFEKFERSRSSIIRPYFELMPLLNQRNAPPERSAAASP